METDVAEKRKHVDDMSVPEKMGYWRDIVAGKIDVSDYELKSMNESFDRSEITIILTKPNNA